MLFYHYQLSIENKKSKILKRNVMRQLACIIVLAWSIVLAYGQPSTIELNTSLSGNQTFEATEWIKMIPNFGYTAAPGNSFIARIVDPGSGSDNEFGYPESPDMSSTESAPVGSISGVFDVSGTGAATFSIPIDVPPGVGGMQPSLAIAYNSQAGNGVAGWGCNISGISVITRVPKTIYHDGVAKGVAHIKSDEYALDGQRLIYAGGSRV